MTRPDSFTQQHHEPAAPERDRAMLAHDLRSALHGIVGGLAMLERAKVDSDVREQLDRMAAASQALSDLVEVFGGDAPGGSVAGRRARRPEVDVPNFVARISRRFAGEARARGRAFRIETGPNPPAELAVDPTSLERALGNLIANAIAHGGDVVRLVLRGSDREGVAFEVHDDGPGLPPSVIRDALRSDDPGRRGPGWSGHGLGLQIARSLCAEMGGALLIENRPSGAFAALVFPASLCGSAEDGFAATASPRPQRPDLRGARVLLAEDNPTNQMVATQMLRALNAEVTLSADGVEALERFESDDFDLVVVDIEMPRMSGLDVIRAIRARSDRRARVPIVALTAYAMREHREQIAIAGADGLISKPITSVDALGEALSAHLPPQAAGQVAPAATVRPLPPALADDAVPVVDLGVYNALCAAIEADMMAELLDKVVADLLQARDVLAAARAPLDRGPIRSSSHILISVAGAIGAARLQACARSLNRAAHAEGGDDLLPPQVSLCIDEIDAAVAFARSRRSEA